LPQLLVLNGSLRGATGNTARLLDEVRRYLPEDFTLREVALASYEDKVEVLVEEVRAADALVFGSGVYWGNWGSPLQRFLEVMTAYEMTEVFLGKPCGAVFTMDSIGGSDAAQRLLGVLSNLGALIPPGALVVISRTGAALEGQPGFEDVWQRADMEILVENVCMAARLPRPAWRTWPFVPTTPAQGLYPAAGVLDLGVERFLERS